ncbi:MAG: LysR family transcriptional regulator [Gammaproteobacteria bacterium]|nr:LysR family transcriptional regulator [Gammaproteobacteria bacterium]
MHQVNWDNLRYVFMVANKGSIAAAARVLGVNRTTVLRRINAFQDSLNCRIFVRSDSGYVLSPEAEKMIDAAREVENTLFDMQREIVGRELKLEGEVRATTTDSLVVSLLGPHLASFQKRHPYIVVNLLSGNGVLDLNRRDADVAIRPTKSPDPGLTGHRLCDLEFGVYAAPDLINHQEKINIFDLNWVGLDDSFAGTQLLNWYRSEIKPESVTMRCDSFVTLRMAAENGLGLALLPHFLGDSSDQLIRLDAPTADLTTGLWILTHPDLVRSARVHAFITHFTEALSA